MEYLTLLSAGYALYVLLRLYISFMQYGYVNDARRGAPLLLSPEEYRTAGSYAMAKEKLGMAGTFLELALFFFWTGIGFAWLEQMTDYDSRYLHAIVFVNLFVMVNGVAGMGLEIYEKFVLDQKYGFNQTTLPLYAMDTLKSAALLWLIGSPVIAGLAWFLVNVEAWWLWSFLFVFAIVVLANLVYPTLIAPMFNKFSPLENNALESKIRLLMERAGFHSNGIFTIDASKRDNRLNAYFGGLGKSKRVVLFDTLVEKLEERELLAVLGHELGHFRHGDIYKNIAVMGGLLFAFFWLFGHLPAELFANMGVEMGPGALIAIFLLLSSPLGFGFMPFINLLSRKNEFAADRYGAELTSAKDLADALKKLVTENKKFPRAHPLYSVFYETHPSVPQRLERLERLEQGAA